MQFWTYLIEHNTLQNRIECERNGHDLLAERNGKEWNVKSNTSHFKRYTIKDCRDVPVFSSPPKIALDTSMLSRISLMFAAVFYYFLILVYNSFKLSVFIFSFVAFSSFTFVMFHCFAIHRHRKWAQVTRIKWKPNFTLKSEIIMQNIWLLCIIFVKNTCIILTLIEENSNSHELHWIITSLRLLSLGLFIPRTSYLYIE